jgi:hypothetical protein
MISLVQAQLPQSESPDRVHEDTCWTEIHGTHYAHLSVVQVTSGGMLLYHTMPKFEMVQYSEVPICL